jgi:hypothetical protein
MFEPNRLAATCLAQAYERVTPITRRTVAAPADRLPADRAEVKRQVVGGGR